MESKSVIYVGDQEMNRVGTTSARRSHCISSSSKPYHHQSRQYCLLFNEKWCEVWEYKSHSSIPSSKSFLFFPHSFSSHFSLSSLDPFYATTISETWITFYLLFLLSFDCNILLLPFLLFDPPLQTKTPSPLLIVSPFFVLLSRRSDIYIVLKDAMRTDSIALMKGKRFSSLSVSFPSHVSFVDTRVSTSKKRESETSCNEKKRKRKIECEVKAWMIWNLLRVSFSSSLSYFFGQRQTSKCPSSLSICLSLNSFSSCMEHLLPLHLEEYPGWRKVLFFDSGCDEREWNERQAFLVDEGRGSKYESDVSGSATDILNWKKRRAVALIHFLPLSDTQQVCVYERFHYSLSIPYKNTQWPKSEAFLSFYQVRHWSRVSFHHYHLIFLYFSPKTITVIMNTHFFRWSRNIRRRSRFLVWEKKDPPKNDFYVDERVSGIEGWIPFSLSFLSISCFLYLSIPSLNSIWKEKRRWRDETSLWFPERETQEFPVFISLRFSLKVCSRRCFKN